MVEILKLSIAYRGLERLVWVGLHGFLGQDMIWRSTLRVCGGVWRSLLFFGAEGWGPVVEEIGEQRMMEGDRWDLSAGVLWRKVRVENVLRECMECRAEVCQRESVQLDSRAK